MRLLDRAILKEMTTVFLLSLMVFTFVMLTNKILRFVELLVNRGVGPLTVLQLFLFILPYMLVYTIPASVLVATMTSFARLSADGELLGLRGAGISLMRLTRPAALFGIAATFLTLVITIWTVPQSIQASKNLLFNIARRQAAVGIQEGIFNSLDGSIILYVEHLDPHTSEMEGVFLVDNRNPEERRILVAQRGRLISDAQTLSMALDLQHGTTYLSGDEFAGRYRIVMFERQTFTLPEPKAFTDPIQRPLGEQELTLTELRERAATLRAEGKNYHPPIVEIHKKLAWPVSCLLFSVVGVSLASRIRRGGRGLSLVVSVALGLGYYVLNVAGESLGDRGKVPEAIAMWLPNLLVAIGGSILLLRAETYPATAFRAWQSSLTRRLGVPRED